MNCKGCEKTIENWNKRKKFCSVVCRDHYHKFKENEDLYGDTLEGEDYVKCVICGIKGRSLQLHIITYHKISIDEYRTMYNDTIHCIDYLKSLSVKVAGDKNPGFNHDGRLSPFSKKFIKGDISEETKLKAHKNRIRNNSYNTNIEYYLKQGMSEEKAVKALSKRQSTFSLDKCIERYGETDGTKRWSERQIQWMNNYKKQNFSKISQSLFDSIMIMYNGDKIYYATKDNPDMSQYENKEYRLTTSCGKTYRPDFIDLDKRKIIEFDGDYWHGKNPGNVKRDAERDSILMNSGYQVFHVKECDYNNNKEKVIQECINFLTS